MEKYTLITGASSGMGALCAIQFSSSRRLIMASENLEMLKDVLNQCANPEQHVLWHCNFATGRESIAQSLSDLLKANDAIVDEYVHFAGLTKLTPLKTTNIATIDLIFNVNLFSIFEITKALLKKSNQKAAPIMRSCLINMSFLFYLHFFNCRPLRNMHHTARLLICPDSYIIGLLRG